MEKRYKKTRDTGYDHVYKIIVVGDSGVGKSQLVSRYSKNFFTSVSRPTVGIECVTHPIKMGQHSICLHIWDLSGDDKFRDTNKVYFRDAIGIVVLYDITKVRSFESVKEWYDQINQSTPEIGCGVKKPITMLVGNKLDLRHSRSISMNEGQQLAKDNGSFFLEASACDGTNVNKVFQRLTEHIYDVTLRGQLPDADQVNTASGLEGGSAALEQDKQPGTYLKVIQKQPCSKWQIKETAQSCASHAKDACLKFSCCSFGIE